MNDCVSDWVNDCVSEWVSERAGYNAIVFFSLLVPYPTISQTYPTPPLSPPFPHPHPLLITTDPQDQKRNAALGYQETGGIADINNSNNNSSASNSNSKSSSLLPPATATATTTATAPSTTKTNVV